MRFFSHRYIIPTLAAIFFAGRIAAQLPDYHVRMLPQKPGLVSPSQVDEMMRDSKGFLWLLTPTKVQRFDGKNILSFSFDDRCMGILQDEEGTVWLASRQNIYRFKNDFEGFEKLADYSSTVNKYLSMPSGLQKKLYLLTTENILQWNYKKSKMEPVSMVSFKTSGSFNFLESYGNCLFFRLSNTTVLRYNTVTAAQDSVHVQEPNYFVPIDEDKVWVRQGIGSTVLVSFKTKTVTPLNKKQFDEAVTDNNFFIIEAFEGRPGEFFTIVVNKGYFSYNLSTNRFKKINFFNNGKLLTGKPLLTRNNFFKENDGTAWFTNEEGVFFLNPYGGSIGLLHSGSSGAGSQWDNDVRNLAEDNKGNIWFSTANGFCKWDKTNGRVYVWPPDYAAKNYLNYSSVKSIGFANGKIIIGQSEKGFWIFDPVKQTFNRPKFKEDSLQRKFESEFNRNMLQLHNGNFLVLSNGLWLLDKETFYIRQAKIPEAAIASRKAYEDAQGRIWLLGTSGITVVDKNFTVLYSLDDKERGKWYNAIIQIDDNTFWVAARTLYEIKLQPQKQLSVKSIFPEFKHQHFSNLFKDSLGHVWMCSDEGMYRYIREKNIAEKFGQSDNIQNFYVSVSNDFRGSDGTVYFGSLNGINYFVPEKIPLQNDSLRVHLLNVTVNQDDSSYRQHTSLKNLTHSQHTVVFDFICPYLYNPEKLRYRYKLSGADEDWVDNGHNTAVRFSSLKPGRYSFQVAASINGTDWFAMEQPFSFVINPPFRQTGWFRILMLLTFIGAIYLLVKWREKGIAEKEAQKTEIEKLKAASYQSQLETEQVINYFATSINTMKTVDELLWDVSKNLIGRLGFEDCMIYLWNEDKTILIQKAGYGMKGSMQSEIHKELYDIPREKGIVGAAVEQKQPLLVNDTSADARYFSVDEKIMLSELCVPIMHDNETQGAINTEHSGKGFYTGRHVQILTTIASLCGDKIDEIKAEQQSRLKEMEVLTLQKDFATSQLTALRMQMNPHFIFNALNSIQHYILQGNVVEANKYLSKFSKLQRDILHCSSQQFITLEKELAILTAYLELEQHRFGKSFSYKINVHDDIEPVEISIPPMILQPFVENAIWHGLMPLQTERMLSIYFDLETDDMLLVTLRDNGIGRSASALLKKENGETKTAHQSKGMSMVQERLQLLQQQYGKPFEVSIADITGTAGQVQGTEVTLKIFIGNKKL